MWNTLIDIDEATRIVLERAHTLEAERINLAAALGRVLARDVSAAEAVPAFDSSAMDGFAVRAADVSRASRRSPVSLSVVEESRAGHPASRAVQAGQAIAISTGAMMPKGADTVLPVEDARAHDGRVEVFNAVQAGRDVRRRGDDLAAGALALASGTRLGAAELGVLASVGCATPLCTRRPRASVLTTGDELLGPEQPLAPGMVRDANAHTVPALVRRAGGETSVIATVPDRPDATIEAIGAALHSDVVVICGGMSVGAHDHVRPSLQALGVEGHFFGVALKPGKPTWFGTRQQTLVFGLPGNPVSAMVTFLLFVTPALWALSGAPLDRLRVIATLTGDCEKPPGRAHAVRCRLRAGEGGWEAEPTGHQGSHVLTSMCSADGLALLPRERGSFEAGERVEVVLLEPGWETVA